MYFLSIIVMNNMEELAVVTLKRTRRKRRREQEERGEGGREGESRRREEKEEEGEVTWSAVSFLASQSLQRSARDLSRETPSRSDARDFRLMPLFSSTFLEGGGGGDTL